jgi:hypothetical protein
MESLRSITENLTRGDPSASLWHKGHLLCEVFALNSEQYTKP